MKKIFLNSSIFYSFLISPFLILLYKIYLKKVSAFGCFDDCFNIVGGYFILQGRTLYSEIFFNHQPLMAYLSAGIQAVSDPINIFALILAHRKFIFIFSIIMNLLIAARFKLAGIGFILFYETTKFYVFGDRFLAEAIIVYPLAYLLGLVWYKLNNKELYKIEYILTAILSWFIVFLREPFIPVALFLFILILLGQKLTRIKIVSIAIFILLTFFLLLKFSLKDYIFNVITINKNLTINQELNPLKIFFYPIYTLFDGESGFFRTILIILSLWFITAAGLLVLKMKKARAIGLIIFILGLVNIRYVVPGKPFYEAFHIAPWYGMFIFTIFIFLQSLWNMQVIQKIKYVVISLLITFFIYIVSPQSFLWDKINQHEEFIINYGTYLSYGETIKILSLPGDTLFVDGFDELIHWQANLPSSYKYSWYTSLMPYIPRYSQARLAMFEKNPPDIYYGSCPKEKADIRLLPKGYKSLYVNLVDINNKPTCLYIKKDSLDKISQNQWKRAKEFGFHP